ncbi:hypothetical protein EV121DRAFT_208649 [Schizophyllum commune]
MTSSFSSLPVEAGLPPIPASTTTSTAQTTATPTQCTQSRSPSTHHRWYQSALSSTTSSLARVHRSLKTRFHLGSQTNISPQKEVHEPSSPIARIHRQDTSNCCAHSLADKDLDRSLGDVQVVEPQGDTLDAIWLHAMSIYEAKTGIDLANPSDALFTSKDGILDFIAQREQMFESSRRSGAEQVRARLLRVTRVVDNLCGPVGEVAGLKTIEVHDEFEAAGKAFETIGYHLRVVGTVCDGPMTDDLREASVQLLAHIMVVLGAITKLQQQKRIRKWLSTLAQSSEIASAMDSLARNVSDYDHIVTATTLNAAMKMMSLLSQSTSHHKTSAIRNFLKYEDPTSVVNAFNEDRASGTCLWFLDGQIFSELKRGQRKAVVLHGKGNSAAIQNLRDDYVAQSPQNRMVLAHFLDPDDGGQSRTLRALLSSLLCQMMLELPHCLSVLETLWAQSKGGASQVRKELLENTLNKLLQRSGCERVIIVIDALDEVTDKGIFAFLERLNGRTDVAMILSCRTAACRFSLENLCGVHVAMDETVVNKDIDILVSGLLAPGGPLGSISNDTDIRELIWENLSSKADGSFRWTASFARDLTSVVGVLSRDVFRQQLAQTPKALRDLYRASLKSIPTQNRSSVIRLLNWAAFSEESVTPSELMELLSFKQGESALPVYAPLRYDAGPNTAVSDWTAVIPFVGSALFFVSGGIVRWVHASAKKYLLSPEAPFSIGDAPDYPLMARTGLAFIKRDDLLMHPARCIRPQRPHHLTWTWVVFASKATQDEYLALEKDVIGVLNSTQLSSIHVSFRTAVLIDHTRLASLLLRRAELAASPEGLDRLGDLVKALNHISEMPIENWSTFPRGTITEERIRRLLSTSTLHEGSQTTAFGAL